MENVLIRTFTFPLSDFHSLFEVLRAKTGNICFTENRCLSDPSKKKAKLKATFCWARERDPSLTNAQATKRKGKGSSLLLNAQCKGLMHPKYLE